jgi:hypothetical protein
MQLIRVNKPQSPLTLSKTTQVEIFWARVESVNVAIELIKETFLMIHTKCRDFLSASITTIQVLFLLTRPGYPSTSTCGKFQFLFVLL